MVNIYPSACKECTRARDLKLAPARNPVLTLCPKFLNYRPSPQHQAILHMIRVSHHLTIHIMICNRYNWGRSVIRIFENEDWYAPMLLSPSRVLNKTTLVNPTRSFPIHAMIILTIWWPGKIVKLMENTSTQKTEVCDSGKFTQVCDSHGPQCILYQIQKLSF